MKVHTKETDGLGSFAEAHFISQDGAPDTLSLQQHQEVDSHHLYDTLALSELHWIEAMLHSRDMHEHYSCEQSKIGKCGNVRQNSASDLIRLEILGSFSASSYQGGM